MLLRQETLRGIQDGSITLAFRRWRRPTVKSGGTLLTAIGQLSIEAVDPVEVEAITEDEAAAAGFSDLASLRSELGRRRTGDVYRVRLHLAGPDPRIALRETVPGDDDVEDVVLRLQRLDSRSGSGPWTRRVLELLDARPGERAADLADRCGVERLEFKADVRKLKGLGLTESLSVGYRLSPRGDAVLERLRKNDGG